MPPCPAPSQQRSPRALSVAAAPAPQTGPPLSAFAETWAPDADFGDLDLAFGDNADFDAVASSAASSPGGHGAPSMTLDEGSRKWTGNEDDFGAFYDAVSGLGADCGALEPDLTQFRVTKELAAEWQKDAEIHNRLFASHRACAAERRNMSSDPDIRQLVHVYMSANDRAQRRSRNALQL